MHYHSPIASSYPKGCIMEHSLRQASRVASIEEAIEVLPRAETIALWDRARDLHVGGQGKLSFLQALEGALLERARLSAHTAAMRRRPPTTAQLESSANALRTLLP